MPSSDIDEPSGNAKTVAPPGRWQRLGLRTQLAIVFGSLMMVLAVCMSLVFGELLRVRMEREASASLNAVASNAADQLSAGLFSRARTVEVMANSSDLWRRGLDSADIGALLDRIRAFTPFSLWIAVADARGIVRNATDGILLGADASQRPWFQQGLKSVHVSNLRQATLLAYSLPPTADGSPHLFVNFAAPIVLDGQAAGVLCLHANWDWAQETLERLQLIDKQEERQIELFIFDQSGKLIYAPANRREALGRLEQRLPTAAAAAHKRPAQAVVWKDSPQRFLTAAVPLQARSAATDLGWHIVARQPLASAYAPARLAMYKVLASGLAAALLAVVIAWLAARRLSHDLKRLARAAHAIHGASPGAEIPALHSSREVGHLSQMLRGTIAKLRAAHDAMEAQVHERTLQLQQANAELELLARSDPLTGLLNRRGFEAQLQYAIALARRSQRPLSLLSVDIDHFKRINDRFGHEMGDTVLREVARILRARLRQSDALARMGGEEFTALLPDTSLEAAVAIAQTLRGLVESHPMAHGQTVTISVGASALRHPHDDDGTMLLRRSDKALYAAKSTGRNTVRWLE